MPKTLILGFGNTHRSDDGAGMKAATALDSELSSSDLFVIAAHQLTPEMAVSVSNSARVLFLDASHRGIAGEIRCEKLERDRGFEPGALSHNLSPQALLEVAARFFQSAPEAWLLTITGENYDFGEEFSSPVVTAWQEYLNRIRLWARSS
jgi:hydrogenase maturation protease